jgi:hypothetical protein
MHRILAGALCALGLAACGTGSSKIDLALTSNDAAPAAAARAAAPGGDLTGVRSIVVTVASVSVHVAGGGATDPATPPAADDGPGWVLLTDEPKVYDLVALKDDFTAPLASGTVPEGKITQIRLALTTEVPETGEGADAVAAAGGPPHDVIPGAVTEMDGTVCDLLVPHSAFRPGIKIVHPWKALPVPAGGTVDAVVNLRVKESRRETTPAGCAYRLNPVIQVTGR